MAKKKRENEDKRRRRILEIATTLFAQEGFHKTNRTKIRTKAHVGEGTISTYFADEELDPKEKVLVEILETGWRNVNQLIEGLGYTADAMDKLRRILSIILDRCAEDRQLKIIFVAHSRELYALGRRLMAGEVRKVVETVESTFAEGQAKGIFRGDLTAKSMQRAFFGTIEEFLHSWVLQETINYETDISRRELEKTIDSLLLGFSVSEESPKAALTFASQ